LPNLLLRLKSAEPTGQELRREVTLLFSRTHLGRIRTLYDSLPVASKIILQEPRCDLLRNLGSRTMKAKDSDYDLIRKMFDRLTRLGGSRRVTPKEADTIRAVQALWTTAGSGFTLEQSRRESLVAMVRDIENRLKVPPYPRFY